MKKGNGRGMNESDMTTVEKVNGRDARLNLLSTWTKTTRQPTKETGQQMKGKKQQKDIDTTIPNTITKVKAHHKTKQQATV